MAHRKFDVSKIARLDDTSRFETLHPDVMWAALGSPDPKAIVEIGAGTGLFSERFAELAPKATVYAVDTEPAMLEWMREHRDHVAGRRLVPVLSEERSVPLRDGIADLVVMLNVHHELEDSEAIYREAHRLLIPGGQLLVVDWADRETPKGPSPDIRASIADLFGVLERAGFSQIADHAGMLAWHHLVTAVRR